MLALASRLSLESPICAAQGAGGLPAAAVLRIAIRLVLSVSKLGRLPLPLQRPSLVSDDCFLPGKQVSLGSWCVPLSSTPHPIPPHALAHPIPPHPSHPVRPVPVPRRRRSASARRRCSSCKCPRIHTCGGGCSLHLTAHCPLPTALCMLCSAHRAPLLHHCCTTAGCAMLRWLTFSPPTHPHPCASAPLSPRRPCALPPLSLHSSALFSFLAMETRTVVMRHRPRLAACHRTRESTTAPARLPLPTAVSGCCHLAVDLAVPGP